MRAAEKSTWSSWSSIGFCPASEPPELLGLMVYQFKCIASFGDM